MPETLRTKYRERARKRFLELLRTRYWTEDEVTAYEIQIEDVLDASEAVEELKEFALDEYRAALDQVIALGLDSETSPSFLVPTRREARGIVRTETRDLLAALDRRVQEWAAKWGLEADWCVDVAYRTLDLWARDPGALARFEWKHRNTAFGAARIAFHVAEWSHIEPFADYRKAAAEELKKQFDGYIAQLEAEAAESQIPTASTPKTPEAFSWTVRQQVLGHSMETVGRDADRSASTVKRGADGVLEHIGLARRRRRTGK